jgi:uncharacterized protein (TIGR03435 family)
MFLMLQSLIEDRFRLKVHRDRELPIYALVASRVASSCRPRRKEAAWTCPGRSSSVGGGRIQPPGRATDRRACAGVMTAPGRADGAGRYKCRVHPGALMVLTAPWP